MIPETTTPACHLCWGAGVLGNHRKTHLKEEKGHVSFRKIRIFSKFVKASLARHWYCESEVFVRVDGMSTSCRNRMRGGRIIRLRTCPTTKALSLPALFPPPNLLTHCILFVAVKSLLNLIMSLLFQKE